MTSGCTIHGHDEWRSTPSRPRGWCARCSRLRNKARRGTLSPQEALELGREHLISPEPALSTLDTPPETPILGSESDSKPLGADSGTGDRGEDSEAPKPSQGFTPPGFQRRPDGTLYREH